MTVSELFRAVLDVLDFEVATVDGSAITLRKIFLSLLFLLLGYLAARFLSALFGRRVLQRLRLAASSAALLQTLAFYVLLAFMAVFALSLADVPLTAFTLLGGAFAIGFGFGSQTLINNFISGIMIAIERSVRPGDLIEVDDTHGTVERIGARASVIRTPMNARIVVPNSSLLEKNVVNWTMSGDEIRTKVTVGVAYGSPTREVERLLLAAARESAEVLPEPAPFVLFADFGDSALVFELYVWLRIQRMLDRRRLESDLRYRIDELFRGSGVVIAFPQRDVHLGPGTVSVRLLGGSDGADGSEAEPPAAAQAPPSDPRRQAP